MKSSLFHIFNPYMHRGISSRPFVIHFPLASSQFLLFVHEIKPCRSVALNQMVVLDNRVWAPRSFHRVSARGCVCPTRTTTLPGRHVQYRIHIWDNLPNALRWTSRSLIPARHSRGVAEQCVGMRYTLSSALNADRARARSCPHALHCPSPKR